MNRKKLFTLAAALLAIGPYEDMPDDKALYPDWTFDRKNW